MNWGGKYGFFKYHETHNHLRIKQQKAKLKKTNPYKPGGSLLLQAVKTPEYIDN